MFHRLLLKLFNNENDAKTFASVTLQLLFTYITGKMVILKCKLETVSVQLSGGDICIHSGVQQSDGGCEEAGTEEENEGGDK